MWGGGEGRLLPWTPLHPTTHTHKRYWPKMKNDIYIYRYIYTGIYIYIYRYIIKWKTWNCSVTIFSTWSRYIYIYIYRYIIKWKTWNCSVTIFSTWSKDCVHWVTICAPIFLFLMKKRKKKVIFYKTKNENLQPKLNTVCACVAITNFIF